jgi:hypothetical protein
VLATRRIHTFILLAAISLLAACSSSSSTPPATPATISIALSPPPASTTIAVGDTTGIQLTPDVSGDTSKQGVDWAVTCSNSLAILSKCGYLSICPPGAASGSCSMHSPGGTAVTYIPPIDFPTGSLTVNVTAFATADHTKNLTTPVTVTSFANALTGTFVFQIVGNDNGNNVLSDQLPYQVTGVMALDGNGNITSVFETHNSFSNFSLTYTLQGSSGTPSTYFVGPDGRGNLTLNLQQANNPSILIQQTFSLVVLSSSKALLAELPTALTSITDTASGTGTLELQTSSALPSGAYAFVTSGIDSGALGTAILGSVSPVPTSIGGILNIDSPGTISGDGSLADQDYFNAHATPQATLFSCTPPAGVTGTVQAVPNAPAGVVTIALKGSTCFAATPPGQIQFTGYVVDANHIGLIETDDVNGSSGFLTAGLAVSQNDPTTGTYVGPFTAASLTGQYLLGVLGIDFVGQGGVGGIPTASTLAFAASICPNGSGTLSCGGSNTIGGEADTLFQVAGLAFTDVFVNGGTNGSSYTVDSYAGGAGIGRAQFLLRLSTQLPKPDPKVLFYLTGDGSPLIMYAMGTNFTFPSYGTGIAYAQPNPATSFGNPATYGVSFTQQNGAENDGTGQMISQSTSASGTLTGALTGTVDDTSATDFTSSTFILSDTFTLATDEFGLITNSTFLNVPGNSGPFVDYFLTGDSKAEGFLIETDLAVGSGQVAFGYFAQACDVTSPTSCAAAAGRSSAKTQRRPGSRRSKKNSNIAVH